MSYIHLPEKHFFLINCDRGIKVDGMLIYYVGDREVLRIISKRFDIHKDKPKTWDDDTQQDIPAEFIKSKFYE